MISKYHQNIITIPENINNFNFRRVSRERFSHSYKKCFVLPSVESHNPPARSPVSMLIHRLVSSSDIICNRSSPPLADIVCFGPLRIVVSLTVLKRVYQKKVSDSYGIMYIINRTFHIQLYVKYL